MSRLRHALIPVMVAAGLVAGPCAAQQAPRPPENVSPRSEAPAPRGHADRSAWDRTKSMTRKEWNAAKKTWASEKVKWRDCNRQAEGRHLTAPKSWSFVAHCMTGS